MEKIEIDFKEYLDERYLSDDEPDLNAFSENELEILLYVKKFFRDYPATQIREFSHNEKGYKETHVGHYLRICNPFANLKNTTALSLSDKMV